MLKKALIFALILNTPYIIPSDSSANSRYDVAAICTVAGTICAWLAYKDLKKGWQALKEANRHLKILNEMGIKIYKVSKTKFESDFLSEFGSLVTKEHYTMDIPSTFSQEQEKTAKEHWGLWLTNEKDSKKIFGWPAIGSLILIPTGIWAFFK